MLNDPSPAFSKNPNWAMVERKLPNGANKNSDRKVTAKARLIPGPAAEITMFSCSGSRGRVADS